MTSARCLLKERKIMRLEEYKRWFEKNVSDSKNPRISELRKIEDHYGNLDEHFANGTYQEIIDSLKYSTKDTRLSKPNPSKIKFNGNVDIRNNLATYKSAAMRYQDFLNDSAFQSNYLEKQDIITNLDTVSNEESKQQRLSLERDMQVALRRNISSLESTLRIIDDGAERAVDSGFIDITCEDDNSIVVVELKAGKTDSRAIAQILGYMGDLQEEDDTKPVRGILVAHDFDKRTKSAASVVPTLSLVKYSIEFKFIAEK